MDTASAITSGLPYDNNDWTLENQQAALSGVAVKQAQDAQNAFNGIDFSDPTSISNGITNLIKSNNIEKASVLAGFAFQQQARQSPKVQRFMNGGASNVTPVAPTDAPVAAAQPGNAPNDDYANAGDVNAQTIAAHSSDTLNQVSTAISNIKGLPVEQRPAAIASLKDQLTQRGVPAEAIDQEANYILSTPDKVGQDQRLDEVANHIQAHADLHGAVAQGQQPTPEQQAAAAASPNAPSVTNGNQQPWYVNRVNSPEFEDMANAAPMMKVAGIDLSPTLQTTRELAQPYVNKDAELKTAGPIANAQAWAKVSPELAEEAAKHQITLSFQNQDAIAAAKKAGAVASAEEQAKNPNEFLTVKDADNKDVVVRKDYALAHAGQNGGLLVTSMSPTEQEFQKTQADAAAKVLTPDNDSKVQSQATLDNSNRAISILDKINTNDLTAFKKRAADALRTIPGLQNPEKYATDVAGYQQLSTQALTQGARQAFPQRVTDRDIKLLHDVYPQISTPKDQAKIAFGTQAAVAQKNLDYENFKAQYDGAHTPQAIQQAWNKQEGNRSNFQSPVWANVNLGGRPAFNPATDIKVVNGKKVGAWGIGTGHPVYFEIQ